MEILESLYYKSEKLDTADRIETKDQLQEVINFVSQFPLSEKYSISAGIEIAIEEGCNVLEDYNQGSGVFETDVLYLLYSGNYQIKGYSSESIDVFYENFGSQFMQIEKNQVFFDELEKLKKLDLENSLKRFLENKDVTKSVDEFIKKSGLTKKTFKKWYITKER